MRNTILFFIIALLFLNITACQKELNFDVINNGLAVGTLKSSAGICLPRSILGTYTKDSVLKTSNYIQVSADITTAGTYLVKSDTIAGFYFIASGTITTTGVQVINLAGSGIPTSTGIKTFTIKFDTSICKIDINVVAAVPPNAVFNFINCAGTSFGLGIYTVGTAVGATHTVTLNINVTTPGPYNIITAAVNGITFSGSGIFTVAGNTQVILTAMGSPATASPPPYNYTVTNGASNCTFSITVAAPAPPPNLDYVPQTTFSNWSTKLVGGTAADTAYIQVSPNSKTFGSNSYKIFEVKDMGNPTDSFFNRKNGGMYYQYIDGNLGVLVNPINKEYLLLDSNAAVNATWTANFGPNVAMGFPLSNIRVDAQVLAKGETRTVASIVYNNVIRVKYTYTVTVIGMGDIPVAEEIRWFARGIGVIHSTIVELLTPATIVTETTRTQIF